MKFFAKPYWRWNEAWLMPISEAMWSRSVSPCPDAANAATRTLVGTNFKDRWFFLYGFEKNERDNVDDRELSALQGIARNLLVLKDAQIKAAIEDGALLEISHGNEMQKPNS